MSESSWLWNSLIAFGALQAIFLAAILLQRKEGGLAKKFFAAFLIIEGITLVERLLAETNLIVDVPHLIGISYPISFLKPPLLLLMVLSVVNRQFKLRKVHAFHLLAFLLILLMNAPMYFQEADFKLKMVRAYLEKTPTYDSFGFWFSLSFFFHIGIYLAVAIRKLMQFREQVKNNGLANWLLKVLVLYVFVLSTHFFYYILQPSGWIELPLFNMISMLLMTFLIQSIAFRFFTEANLFNGHPAPDLSNVDQLTRDESRIKTQMEDEKMYLDDALTLADFATSLDLPKKYVSDIINQRFGRSFKDLINHYRVEEAKKMMADQLHAKVSLLDIALESGFNNKVSFYRTFKKHTGKAPSVFFDELKADHSTGKSLD